MAHNIEVNGTQAAFVSARQDAWHQLGTVMPQDGLTAEEALRIAHLADWNVHKEPMTLADGTPVPDAFANVRTNPFNGGTDVLGVVGNHYASFQNEDGAALLNAITDESGASIQTAGSLNDGRQTFVTMRLPEDILVGGQDQVGMYIAALNSHDGNSSFKIILTPVRIVCANTQQAALNQATGKLTRRHTAGGTGVVINDARLALDMTFRYVADFEQAAERMIQESYTNAQFSRLTGSLFPTPDNASDKRRDFIAAHRMELSRLWQDSDTLQTVKGTRWGAYQAVTEYLDHVLVPRDSSEDQARTRRARAAINLDSTSNKMKARAFGLLTAK